MWVYVCVWQELEEDTNAYDPLSDRGSTDDALSDDSPFDWPHDQLWVNTRATGKCGVSEVDILFLCI